MLTNLEFAMHRRVWGLYVDQTLRQHGIARSMMDDLLLRIRGVEGLCQVSLSVATTQVAARGLYKSVGFTPFGLELRALRIGDDFVDEEHQVLVLDLSAERVGRLGDSS
jgi:ribosomal protein S18 acetylase RimI-like enzyme